VPAERDAEGRVAAGVMNRIRAGWPGRAVKVRGAAGIWPLIR